MKIKDLSKPELILLIQEHWEYKGIDETALLSIRWQFLAGKAALMRTESMVITRSDKARTNRAEHLRGHNMWMASEKLQDKSDDALKRMNELYVLSNKRKD